MSETKTPSETITEEVTSWPGVEPGMKKFHPQLQLSEILAMADSPSLCP